MQLQLFLLVNLFVLPLQMRDKGITRPLKDEAVGVVEGIVKERVITHSVCQHPLRVPWYAAYTL